MQAVAASRTRVTTSSASRETPGQRSMAACGHQAAVGSARTPIKCFLPAQRQLFLAKRRGALATRLSFLNGKAGHSSRSGQAVVVQPLAAASPGACENSTVCLHCCMKLTNVRSHAPSTPLSRKRALACQHAPELAMQWLALRRPLASQQARSSFCEGCCCHGALR